MSNQEKLLFQSVITLDSNNRIGILGVGDSLFFLANFSNFSIFKIDEVIFLNLCELFNLAKSLPNAYRKKITQPISKNKIEKLLADMGIDWIFE